MAFPNHEPTIEDVAATLGLSAASIPPGLSLPSPRTPARNVGPKGYRPEAGTGKLRSQKKKQRQNRKRGR